MKNIDALTEEFKTKYERFWIGCDAQEELERWDKEEYGEMDVFYQNDLLSLILRLIAADGKIHDKETAYLNETFGFAYTTEELAAVYRNCRKEIGRSFDEQFKNGISLLRSLNGKLADAYQELLVLICDIIAESDGVIAPEERETARSIKSLIA